MRPPTQDEIAGLRLMRAVAQTHINAAGVNANPKIVNAAAWLDDLIATAAKCQDWPVGLALLGCEECLGERSGSCVLAEIRRLPDTGAEMDGPAPSHCALRDGGTILLRGD